MESDWCDLKPNFESDLFPEVTFLILTPQCDGFFFGGYPIEVVFIVSDEEAFFQGVHLKVAVSFFAANDFTLAIEDCTNGVGR